MYLIIAPACCPPEPKRGTTFSYFPLTFSCPHPLMCSCDTSMCWTSLVSLSTPPCEHAVIPAPPCDEILTINLFVIFAGKKNGWWRSTVHRGSVSPPPRPLPFARHIIRSFISSSPPGSPLCPTTAHHRICIGNHVLTSQ